MNLIGLSTGIVFGVMTYAFGPGVRPFTLLNGNILLMAFLVSYGHLRHSHMWIAFTGVAGRILQSPAHHQLHHSANPVHYERTSALRSPFGTGVRHPRHSREDARTGRIGVGDRRAPFRSAVAAFVSLARASPGMSAPSRRPGEGAPPGKGCGQQLKPNASLRAQRKQSKGSQGGGSGLVPRRSPS